MIITMKGFFKWLTGPHVLPLVARLLLVGLTALAASHPEPALALGVALEGARPLLGNRQ